MEVDSLRPLYQQISVHGPMSCHGYFAHFDAMAVWTAKAEGKQKLHAWLALQGRAQTADNLTKKNWPCNAQCPLCDQEPETIDHISLNCAFAKQVWLEIRNWQNVELLMQEDSGSDLETWWNKRLSGIPKEEKRRRATIIIYTMWGLWNERNRRTFQHRAADPKEVLMLIKEEMRQRERAFGNPGGEDHVGGNV